MGPYLSFKEFLMEINNSNFDVIGIGSALLDFTVEVNDSDLDTFNLKKGEMMLIDADQSKQILAKLESYNMQVTPGGSSANTIAGVANFGGKGVLMGRVGSDEHGKLYIDETEKIGVKTFLSKGDAITGHAITFITPDSERTFATHLGAAINFTKDDVSEDAIKNSKILHFEGYLFEPPTLREACMRALEIAKMNNVLVSLDLSDPGLIGRIKDVFEDVLKNYVNIAFVNEDEAAAFTGKEEAEALEVLAEYCDFAVVKLGGKGSLIKYQNEVTAIDPVKVDVVNTNGAGDMFAAGVLYGISQGMSAAESGRLGSYAAAQIVSQVSARHTDSFTAKDILK